VAVKENPVRPAGQNIPVVRKNPVRLKNLAAPNNPALLKIQEVKRWLYATKRETRIR
jgi:hypothetical protein